MLLRVETPFQGVFILALALFTKRKRSHGDSFAVVRNILNDAVTRPQLVQLVKGCSNLRRVGSRNSVSAFGSTSGRSIEAICISGGPLPGTPQ